MMRHFICTLFLCSLLLLAAQEAAIIKIPDKEIIADRLIRGNGDTYSMGDCWCSFRLSRTNDMLMLNGEMMAAQKSQSSSSSSFSSGRSMVSNTTDWKEK